ncbi:MAG: LytR/AlgR family response regulator transcription factor [Roseateles asaccharophilus]|uniref:LytTR family two component transcriptional regulator n=1 Tax=Roseateles asaccharophilus TaxID=582607 RepID=A0A4R6NCD9_9BURK|nr:LytTR family DNA-binding domain-containing protein [Roseateles asaccharophilus]MDN3542969.1 LytTR family DNA-binding domain-containing protein [Roseateles asaccharophilus]TDP13331.1 LytTR family two component transcriptional regulator [Roseateles asaccharophilus]
MKVLIADDEEGPREQLRTALQRLAPDVQLVAQSCNGVDAWDEALQHEPDVCLLDIRMPGLNGLEVARRLSQLEAPPQIVFVSAHGDHALSAFEAGAVDYVLKPVDDARLLQTLGRVRERASRMSLTPDSGALRDLLQRLLPGAPRPGQRPIQASLGREIKLIAPDEIIYFESDSRYTRVVHQGGEALIRTPLKELLTQLDVEQFWQVHRSVIVNCRCVASAIRVDESTMQLTLKGREEKLPVSRQFQGLFKGQ